MLLCRQDRLSRGQQPNHSKCLIKEHPKDILRLESWGIYTQFVGVRK
jgi:hypothetical protein